MTKIALTRGLFAVVDPDDFGWLSQWKWNARKSGARFYASRTSAAILMHREILRRQCLTFQIVDHINGDTLDNRKTNLRPATVHDNAGNQPKRRGRSRFKGVYFDVKSNSWRASISINGANVLSPMLTEIDAALWYNVRAKEYFGDFALLNTVP